MEIKTTSLKGFRIVALLSLVCAAATLVLSGISLGTMGEVYGVAPAMGDIITYLYQIHGFFALFLGAFAVAFLFLHRRREIVAKIAAWGMMILGVMHVTPFFTDTIFYLGTVSFGQGLNYFSAYLPALMISVVCIALLSNWTNPDPYVVNRAALICSLISIFMCIVYLVQASTLLGLTSTLHDNAQIWGLISGNLGLTIACVLMWALTSSRRRFERLMYDMSDRQAAAYEIVDERVDKEARSIEAEVNAAFSLRGPLFGSSRKEQEEEIAFGPVQIPVEYAAPEPEPPRTQPAPPERPAVRQTPPAPTPAAPTTDTSAPGQAAPAADASARTESAPAQPAPTQTSPGRFIPASENLYGELPLQRRRKKNPSPGSRKDDW